MSIIMPEDALTFCMNFLHTNRMSLDRVALNIITCLLPETARKIS